MESPEELGYHGAQPPPLVRKHRHIPPGVKWQKVVTKAAQAKPPPPPEVIPEIPADHLVEIVNILRQRAPSCFLCRMIVASMVGGELRPYCPGDIGAELFPVRGQVLHALDEWEMSRSPDWVAARQAVLTR